MPKCIITYIEKSFAMQVISIFIFKKVSNLHVKLSILILRHYLNDFNLMLLNVYIIYNALEK